MKKKQNIPDDVKQKVLKILFNGAERQYQQSLDEESMKSLEQQLTRINDGS